MDVDWTFSWLPGLAIRSLVAAGLAWLGFLAARRLNAPWRARMMGVCVTAIVALPLIPGLPSETAGAAPTAVVQSWLGAWLPAIGAVWLGGILWHAARFCAGTLTIGRIATHPSDFAVPEALRELGAGIRVQTSPAVEAPFACGIFRKRVLLPNSARNWPAERLTQVLAHEFHHHRAGDLWLQNLSHLICAVFWWNPLVWRLSDEWQREREFAADRAVLKVATPKSYAQNLLDFSLQTPPANRILAAALYMTRRGSLETRIERLLAGPAESAESPRSQFAAGLCLATIVLAMPLCVAWIPVEFSRPSSPELQREAQIRLTADPFPGN